MGGLLCWKHCFEVRFRVGLQPIQIFMLGYYCNLLYLLSRTLLPVNDDGGA